MPHEAVGEILVGLLEMGIEAGTNGNKNNKPSCMVAIVIFMIIIGVVIYYLN